MKINAFGRRTWPKLGPIHAHERPQAHVHVVTECISTLQVCAEWNPNVEPDVCRRTGAFVHVWRSRIVRYSPCTDVVIGEIACIIDCIMAISDGLRKCLRALGKSSHRPHIAAHAVLQFVVGQIVDTLRTVVPAPANISVKTAETSAIRVSEKIAKTVSRHAEV